MTDAVSDMWRPRLAAVPLDPSEAMLGAAREWYRVRYGETIVDDALVGCWSAMIHAYLRSRHPTPPWVA